MNTNKLIILFLIICLTTPQLMATILGGSLTGGSALTNGGVFEELIPPIGSVGDDNHQSNNLFGFNEDQNILLTAPLSVNIGPSPTLSAGTEVASHYIFFDPGPTRRAIGHVIFDSEVLAIMTKTAQLDASDFLANVSATYLNPGLRGLESGDSVSIDGSNPAKINIDFTASTPGDYIRVLTTHSPTAVVPEPSTYLLMACGFFGLFFIKRRHALSKQ